MKQGKQGKFLRSCFMQLEDGGEEEDSNEEFVSIPIEFNLNDAREVSKVLEKYLDEFMFLEVGEGDEQGPAALFTECMNTQTRHVSSKGRLSVTVETWCWSNFLHEENRQPIRKSALS